MAGKIRFQSRGLLFYWFFKVILEGSLEVKLPTIWTDEKQRWEESEKRGEEKKKEDQIIGPDNPTC